MKDGTVVKKLQIKMWTFIWLSFLQPSPFTNTRHEVPTLRKKKKKEREKEKKEKGYPDRDMTSFISVMV